MLELNPSKYGLFLHIDISDKTSEEFNVFVWQLQ